MCVCEPGEKNNHTVELHMHMMMSVFAVGEGHDAVSVVTEVSEEVGLSLETP